MHGFIEFHDASVKEWSYTDGVHRIRCRHVGIYETEAPGKHRAWLHEVTVRIEGPGPERQKPPGEGWIVGFDVDGEDVGMAIQASGSTRVSGQLAELTFNDGATVSFENSVISLEVHAETRKRGELFVDDPKG